MHNANNLSQKEEELEDGFYGPHGYKNAGMHIYVYIATYLCVYECMYVSMYVDISIYTYICKYI